MNQILAQAILLVLALGFAWYVMRVRTLVTDRLILILLAVAAVVLIFFPNLSTWLANLIGIGRGTDMIFYFFILFALFRFVGISADRREMQRQLTDVVRRSALQNPRAGKGLDPDSIDR